jgi:hypothetical protein
MARTVRDTKLETWEQRFRLQIDRRYFRDMGDGIALTDVQFVAISRR